MNRSGVVCSSDLDEHEVCEVTSSCAELSLHLCGSDLNEDSLFKCDFIYFVSFRVAEKYTSSSEVFA
jgi:hypothetical protein